ncbi:MAG TPA: N-formylglutamate amidohydrolase [Acidobacteriota bacterium]|nr:N-formylglutamate amidohydrolase [Acidobacteriota bacterium]
MSVEKIWSLRRGESPLVATAIHAGHEVREEVGCLLALTEEERLREEDPFTDSWTHLSDTRVKGLRSRFEVDLNRPREKAVYLTEEDAWGLKTWKNDLPAEIADRSLAEYDAFYSEMHSLMRDLENRHGRFIVFDLHSYNHRREGVVGPPADPKANPDVNVGTGTMERERWAPIIDRFIRDLSSSNFLGSHLDVRENVRFRGGNFPGWVHRNFPETGCAVAIEVKKFFMDEWKGEPDQEKLRMVYTALKSTVPGVLEELSRLG